MVEGQSTNQSIRRRDRISELPYLLLLHILRLFTRKEAARTSILSTKWTNLWKIRFLYPTILAFGREYQDENDQCQLASEVELQMSKLREKKIETLSLYFNPGDTYKDTTTRWIRQAVVSGVEEFYLDFSQGNLGPNPSGRLTGRRKRFELKEDVFQSNNSLTILCLSYCNLPRTFKFRYFNSLQKMYLHGINLNDRMLAKLMSYCGQLKALDLRECIPLRCIKVWCTNHCLLTLTIVNCLQLEEIYVAAPLLQSFHLFGVIPKSLHVDEDVHSLRSAIVISTIGDYLNTPITSLRLYRNMGLEHVHVLTLSSSVLQLMFGSWALRWINCGNVRELHLLVERIDDYDLINIYKFFMQCHLPFLERLFIEFPASLSGTCTSQGVTNIPWRVFNNLKQIKIIKFNNHRNEMQLVKFMLCAAANLERITLVVSDEYYGDMTALHYWLMLQPRASSNSQILTIHSYEDDQSIMPMHSQVIRGFRDRRPQFNGPRV